VKSAAPAALGGLTRDLTGDSIDFGYNLAMHLEPTDRWAFTATYRSKVDLTVKGDASLSDVAGTAYSGGANVTIPLPAALALAAAFDVTNDTTFEFVFERTYWGAYEELDFNYSGTIASPGGAGLTARHIAAFDDAKAKDWSDVNTYRFGLTHRYNEKLTLMGGFAIDESPAPTQTIGFELPESDGKIYSLGARYKMSKNIELGGAVLYTKRDKLQVSAAANDNGLTGEFSNAGALLVSLGAIYRFD